MISVISNSQVLCIQCYNQNQRISDPVENMIVNGGFELKTCLENGFFCPNSTSYNCDIANWNSTGGSSGTYAQVLLKPGINTNYCVYFGNALCNICSPSLDDTS